MDSTPILTPRTGTPALSEACEQLEAEECEQPETIGLQGQVERQAQSAPALPTVEEPEPPAVMKPKRTYSKKPTDEQVLNNLRTATRRTRGEAPELQDTEAEASTTARKTGTLTRNAQRKQAHTALVDRGPSLLPLRHAFTTAIKTRIYRDNLPLVPKT